MMMSPNKSFDKSIYASVREKFAPRISYERISFYIFFFFFFYEESGVELIFRRKFKKNRKARKKGSTNQKSC